MNRRCRGGGVSSWGLKHLSWLLSTWSTSGSSELWASSSRCSQTLDVYPGFIQLSCPQPHSTGCTWPHVMVLGSTLESNREMPFAQNYIVVSPSCWVWIKSEKNCVFIEHSQIKSESWINYLQIILNNYWKYVCTCVHVHKSLICIISWMFNSVYTHLK